MALGGRCSCPTVVAMTAGGPADPATVGRYRLIQRLGEGGMGIVHLALDPQGRAVALKLLRAHVAADPDARRRMEREVRTLRQVRHPRVAEVLDAELAGPMPYLVTRFVPGKTLDQLVREQGPLGAEHAVRLGRALADALSAIHAAGIVHRDLKPANVMVVDGEPVIIDFGIAHFADESRITVAGLVMGTPGYLSPEVVEGQRVTHATDWWGWGSTVAYAASGRPPFGNGPTEAVLDRVRRGRADLDEVREPLRSVLASALVVDPSRRAAPARILAWLGAGPAAAPGTGGAVGPDGTGAAGTTVVSGFGVPGAEVGPGAWADRSAVGPPVAGPDDRTVRYPPPGARPTPTVRGSAPVPPTVQYTPEPPDPVRPHPGPVEAPAPLPRPPAAQSPRARPPTAQIPATAHPAAVPPGTHPGTAGPAGYPGGRPGPTPQPGHPGGHPAGIAGPPVGPYPGPGASPAPVPPGAQPDWGPPADLPPPRPTGTILLGGTALAGVAAVAPGGALVLLLFAMVMGRTVDRSATSLWRRRQLAGPRAGDVPVAVVSLPWQLVQSVFASLLALVLPVLVAISVAFIAGTAVVQDGSPSPASPLPLALAGFAAAVTGWWGPGGASFRRGSRSAAQLAIRGSVSRLVVWSFLGLVVLSAVLVALQGEPVDWAPFPSPRAALTSGS